MKITKYNRKKNIASNSSNSESDNSIYFNQSKSSNTITTTDAIIIKEADGIDRTDEIQKAIIEAYNNKKKIIFDSGNFIVTRGIFLFDGIQIEGQGIYNTIIRTPFIQKAKYYSTDSADYEKAKIGEQLVEQSKGSFSTATQFNTSLPELSTIVANGHNRFYLGNGIVGFYDGDRDTNVNHPLYYPKPADENSEEYAEWKTWFARRDKIQKQGRYIGRTGREGYAGGLFLSCQNPDAKHTKDKNSAEYVYGLEGTYLHCGIRDVTIKDLTITTNSIDRGKDSAIDFDYDASLLKGKNQTYDSSCLKILLENLWLRDLGGYGYKVYRAVQNSIINCSVWRCAETGFKFDGVTSIQLTNCYANSCYIGGYSFSGVNYSTLNSCAADGCGQGYKFDNCNAITINSCGAEATRYLIKTEDDESEALQKGKSFAVSSSKGITFNSCYSFSFRNRDANTFDGFDNVEYDDTMNTSCHYYFSGEGNSNIYVNAPISKSMLRIRTTPFKKSSGEKCNYQGGTYDDSTSGSRIWQIQNFLVGSQYYVEDSSDAVPRINHSDDISKELTQNSIRCYNVDIYDPATIPNPLKNVNTAGKLLRGADGLGGWTKTVNGTTSNISLEEFENLFPLNGNLAYGQRELFWEWRNSLKLVQIDSETKGETTTIGFREYQNKDTIDWSAFTEEQWNNFTLDIVKDRNNIDRLDGLFNNQWISGGFYHSSDNHKVWDITDIGKVNSNGSRISINNVNTDYQEAVKIVGDGNKASLTVVGAVAPNEYSNDTEKKYDPTLQLLTAKSSLSLPSGYRTFTIKDSNFNETFAISGTKQDGRLIYNYRYPNGIISMNQNDIKGIGGVAVAENVPTSILSNKINQLITVLEKHGLLNKVDDKDRNITATINADNTKIEESSALLNFSVTANNIPIYKIGIAYSKTENPTYSNNHIEADSLSLTQTLQIPRDTDNNVYLRFYANSSSDSSESNRFYSEQFTITTDGSVIDSNGNTIIEGIKPYYNFKLESYAVDGTAVTVNISCDSNITLYRFGICYSNSTNPTYSNNYKIADGINGIQTIQFTRKLNVIRYFKMFVEISETPSESSRIYSEQYQINIDGTITKS